MNIFEKKKIRKGVLEITNRVKKFGRDSEVVTINVKLVMTGQEAINYKVMRLFASTVTNQELVDLTFQMGIISCVDRLRIIALENEIQL